MAARKKTTPKPEAVEPKQTEAQAAVTKAYNEAYAAYVTFAASAIKITGDDLVAAHAFASRIVRVATKAGDLACTRCNGTGKVPFEIEDGRCFACTTATEQVAA